MTRVVAVGSAADETAAAAVVATAAVVQMAEMAAAPAGRARLAGSGGTATPTATSPWLSRGAGAPGAATTPRVAPAVRVPGGQGALSPSPEMGARPQRTRTGLVYVTDSAKTSFHPRIVQLGQGNLDYTEAVAGLKEGERVVM